MDVRFLAMRILSGIQPTGALHIGNYFGMMRPALALQNEGEAFYFIADYHALTSIRNPAMLRETTRSRAPDLPASEALLRIVGAIDDYLYSNEHCPDGTRRSIFSGPHREKLMGGHPPAGAALAADREPLLPPDDRGGPPAPQNGQGERGWRRSGAQLRL